MSLFKDRAEYRPYKYSKAELFTDLQRKNFWDAKKIIIKGDIQEYLTEFNTGTKHAIQTCLKLFTHYEVGVGDFWRMLSKFFKPHEIQAMLSMNSCMELAVHAVFYDRLNAEMGLSTKEFYLSFLQEPNLKARMDILKKYLKPKTREDLLLSLAVYTAIEGVVLYSSFAFLMSFQSNGMNKLSNVVTGLRYSTRDEFIHAEGTSWLFNETCAELGVDRATLKDEVYESYNTLVLQEDLIIDEMFSQGGIKHITAAELKAFVRHRANKKLLDMGFNTLFIDTGYETVATWFYDMINAPELTDFFHNEVSAYEMTADFGTTKRKDWKALRA